MASDNSKKTPLFALHKKANAKIVEFGGWLMPVSYEGVLAEHKRVRESCGLFDVSHMGEIRVKGPEAEKYVQHLAINDASKLKPFQGQYSAILRPSGGMIDDLIVYRLANDEFFICVNASNIEKDFAWFDENASKFAVKVTNESEKWSQLAVQGPNSTAAVTSILGATDKEKIKALPYAGIMSIQIFGVSALLARTGYTGEIGYELYVPNEIAEHCWVALLETEHLTGIKPIGLGARDTLRLEACYLLYGNDMDESVSPLEAGIGWATKIDKGEFIGKPMLVIQKAEGVKRKICAFKMNDDGIPRHDMQVYANGVLGGKVTSGSVLPTLGGAGGMALLSSSIKEGDQIEIDIRGKRKLATIAKRPLYSPKVK